MRLTLYYLTVAVGCRCPRRIGATPIVPFFFFWGGAKIGTRLGKEGGASGSQGPGCPVPGGGKAVDEVIRLQLTSSQVVQFNLWSRSGRKSKQVRDGQARGPGASDPKT